MCFFVYLPSNYSPGRDQVCFVLFCLPSPGCLVKNEQINASFSSQTDLLGISGVTHLSQRESKRLGNWKLRAPRFHPWRLDFLLFKLALPQSPSVSTGSAAGRPVPLPGGLRQAARNRPPVSGGAGCPLVGSDFHRGSLPRDRPVALLGLWWVTVMGSSEPLSDLQAFSCTWCPGPVLGPLPVCFI